MQCSGSRGCRLGLLRRGLSRVVGLGHGRSWGRHCGCRIRGDGRRGRRRIRWCSSFLVELVALEIEEVYEWTYPSRLQKRAPMAFLSHCRLEMECIGADQWLCL